MLLLLFCPLPSPVTRPVLPCLCWGRAPPVSLPIWGRSLPPAPCGALTGAGGTGWGLPPWCWCQAPRREAGAGSLPSALRPSSSFFLFTPNYFNDPCTRCVSSRPSAALPGLSWDRAGAAAPGPAAPLLVAPPCSAPAPRGNFSISGGFGVFLRSVCAHPRGSKREGSCEHSGAVAAGIPRSQPNPAASLPWVWVGAAPRDPAAPPTPKRAQSLLAQPGLRCPGELVALSCPLLVGEDLGGIYGIYTTAPIGASI